MATSTISTEQLREHLASAQSLAEQGPVFVADSGATRFVILAPQEYRRLSGTTSAQNETPPSQKPFRSLADIFSESGLKEADADLELERLNWTFTHAEFLT